MFSMEMMCCQILEGAWLGGRPAVKIVFKGYSLEEKGKEVKFFCHNQKLSFLGKNFYAISKNKTFPKSHMSDCLTDLTS